VIAIKPDVARRAIPDEVAELHRPERGGTWCAGCIEMSGRLEPYPSRFTEIGAAHPGGTTDA
jgi:hypothetical protein